MSIVLKFFSVYFLHAPRGNQLRLTGSASLNKVFLSIYLSNFNFDVKQFRIMLHGATIYNINLGMTKLFLKDGLMLQGVLDTGVINGRGSDDFLPRLFRNASVYEIIETLHILELVSLRADYLRPFSINIFDYDISTSTTTKMHEESQKTLTLIAQIKHQYELQQLTIEEKEEQILQQLGQLNSLVDILIQDPKLNLEHDLVLFLLVIKKSC